jgi:hypothetical protein
MELNKECLNSCKTIKTRKICQKSMIIHLQDKTSKINRMINKVCKIQTDKTQTKINSYKVYIQLSNKIDMMLFNKNKLYMISQTNKE